MGLSRAIFRAAYFGALVAAVGGCATSKSTRHAECAVDVPMQSPGAASAPAEPAGTKDVRQVSFNQDTSGTGGITSRNDATDAQRPPEVLVAPDGKAVTEDRPSLPLDLSSAL